MFGFKRTVSPDIRTPSPNLPYQVMRLSFQSKGEYDTYRKQHPKVFDQVWHWQRSFANRPEPFTFPGICEMCDATTNFRARPQAAEHKVFRHEVRWWKSATCERCGMSNADRVLARTLLENSSGDPSVHHVGHFSNARRWLGTRFARASLGHFTLGSPEGNVAEAVRFENLDSLPQRDGSVDMMLISEVLQFAPDLSKALSEIHRVLRKGGKALMSVPWVGQEDYENKVRARLQPDGSTEHIEPASHHHDNVTGESFLRFRAFGWKFLDDLRSAGFSRASAEYAFAPVHGYMTLHPVFTATR
jgi:SAM-dependent methyltransferase